MNMPNESPSPAVSITTLWEATVYIDDPEMRRTLRSSLPDSGCDDSRTLAALLSVIEGDEEALVALVDGVDRLTGRLGEADSPWNAFVQFCVPALPEASRQTVIAAVLPKLQEDVMTQMREWIADPNSVDLEALRQVIEDNVPAINEAGVAAMAKVAEDPDPISKQTEESQRIGALIKEYNDLAAQFRSYCPNGRQPDKQARRLLELEATLNAYWKAFPALMWGGLVAQGRFLSGGSSGVVGWYRDQGRYDEAVAHMCTQFADVELSRLRQQSHRRAFEVLFNNGLGSFLDSGDPAHIPLGVAILDDIEAHLSPLVGEDALHQAACLLARDGQVNRALDYVQRAVNAGVPMRWLAMDSDLKCLHQTRRFQRLLQAA